MRCDSMSAISAVLVIAGSGLAQQAGDVVFTGLRDGTVNLFAYSGSSITQLIDLDTTPGVTQENFLGGIDAGPDGTFYVAGGNPNPGVTFEGIYRIDDLFGSASSSILAQGDDSRATLLQAPRGLVFDRSTNTLLTANNPGSPPRGDNNAEDRFEGIARTDLGGNTTIVYDQPFGDRTDPKPRVNNTSGIRSKGGAGEFMFLSLDGGLATDDVNQTPNQINLEASTLWNLNATTGDIELFFDFSNTAFGTLSQIRDFDILPNGDVIVADADTSAIYVINVDGNGDAASFDKIADIAGNVAGVTWNRYKNHILYTTLLNDDLGAINLDGTGNVTLATNFEAGGLYIIPAPAAGVMAVLAGLGATRRRR